MKTYFFDRISSARILEYSIIIIKLDEKIELFWFTLQNSKNNIPFHTFEMETEPSAFAKIM